MACIDLTGRAVLVVGAGRVALEKIEGLLAAGAEVTVVAPQVLPEVEELDADDSSAAATAPDDLDGKFLVVAATATTSVNRRVFRDAEARALLCNVVDVPELCSFILPAVHRHEPIAVAVSTGGASPALAQHLRDQIATVVRPEHAELAAPPARAAAVGQVALRHLRGAQGVLRRARRGGARRMTVHLVGAGPGDPGLITARGLELVRACDVLVADVLVAQELIDEAPDDAIVISRAGMKQEAVTRLLVAYGTTGLDTVRLKGGDPFVFGRGGEEALALAEAGIPFEIVPGVSSIAAVPASALIPVTHRGVSDRVTIASGHGADGGEPDYASLAAAGGTLVLFMGLERVEQLCRGLVAAGLPASTPAAVVSRGTLPDQESVSGTLETLAELAAGLESPALVIVGEVVAVGAEPRGGDGRARDRLSQRARLIAWSSAASTACRRTSSP